MPEHVLMSALETITEGGRRRRWSASEKLRIVEKTLEEEASILVVARRHGVAPNLLYRWRRLMLDGAAVAVSEDDDVTSIRAVWQMEERMRELERQLGRKTLEACHLARDGRDDHHLGFSGRNQIAVAGFRPGAASVEGSDIDSVGP